MASISSINIIAGDLSLACLNKSRHRSSNPYKHLDKVGTRKWKNGTLASPATAFAKRVFLFRVNPPAMHLSDFTSNTVYLVGFFKKSTISCTSSFAPSSPATSSGIALISLFSSKSLALTYQCWKFVHLHLGISWHAAHDEYPHRDDHDNGKA